MEQKTDEDLNGEEKMDIQIGKGWILEQFQEGGGVVVLGAGAAGGGGVPPPNAASFVFAVTELTRLLFHRREAEDVGVRGRGRGLRAPHIHSVYDIPSLVSPTRSPRLRHHSSSSPPPPPWCFQSVTSIFCSTPPMPRWPRREQHLLCPAAPLPAGPGRQRGGGVGGPERSRDGLHLPRVPGAGSQQLQQLKWTPPHHVCSVNPEFAPSGSGRTR